ncbi:shieldin complex subunit 3 isoform 1-T2 [Polymixia lowei]
MEDVVLHYKPGDAGDLNSLVEKTGRVLESFSCRVQPVFNPWFPSARDRWLPIRPSRPAPILISAINWESSEKAQTHQDSTNTTSVPCASQAERPPDFTSNCVQGREEPPSLTRQPTEDKQQNPKDGVFISERPHDLLRISLHSRSNHNTQAETTKLSTEKQPKHGLCVPETPNDLAPTSLSGRTYPNRRMETQRLSPDKQPQKHKDGGLVTDGEVRRSWSVFAHKGHSAQNSQSLSKQFHKMVWKHRLHLHQRAKWLICEHNCGSTGNIEQVWRELNRAIRSSRLPTANANIQREQAEIWVFCDVVHCEYVGKYLKEELRLSGKITMSVHKLGNILSL